MLSHRLLTWGVFAVIVLTGAVVIKTHPTKYASSGTVLFVESESLAQRETSLGAPVDPATQSTLARFDNPTVVADIFARTYESWDKQTDLARAGLHGTLLVSTATTDGTTTTDHGPVIVFTVVGPDPIQTEQGVTLVIADLQRELAVWQQGADPNLSVTDVVVTSPDRGLVSAGSRSRSAVAVVAFAALLAWLVGQSGRMWTSRRTQVVDEQPTASDALR